MKKIIALVSMLVTSLAFAQHTPVSEPVYYELELNPSKVYAGGQRSNGGSATLGTHLLNYSADLKVETERFSAKKNWATNVQGRLGYAFGPVWVRGGLGEQITSGKEYAFYTLATGANVPLTKRFTVVGEFERRDGLRQANTKTNLYKIGGEYALNSTRSNTVGVSWNVESGDTVSHGVSANFVHSF